MDRKKRKIIGKATIPHVQTDAEDSQIAPVGTIDEFAQAIFDGFRTSGQHVEVEQHDN